MNHLPRFTGRVFQLPALLAIAFVFGACSGNVTPEEAKVLLAGTWKLSQASIDGKPVFKDGQQIEQFGEAGFGRYMEEVSFLPDGRFQGKFKGDERVMSFSWEAQETEIVVTDTVPNSGKWHIPYRTLKQNAFDMETETNAYNPPALTRIRLSFKK